MMNFSTNKNRLFVTIGVLFAIFLSSLDNTVVGIAMPKIVRDLGGFESYAWIFTIYLLTSTIAMPFWGRASDHWGRKKLFIAAMILFVLGSLLCGLSQNFTQLIIFRAIKGIGGGGLIPIAFTILADIYDLHTRTKIQGWVSSVWGMAAALGPFVGGILADTLGWRWIFFVNILPCIIGVFFVLKFFHEEKTTIKLKLSLQSFLASVLFISSLMIALLYLQDFQFKYAACFFIIAILSFALFRHTEKIEKYPLIPVELYKHRIFNMTCITGFLSSSIIMGLTGFAPLLFQIAMDYSATESGFLVLPFTYGWLLGSVFSVKFILKRDYKKPLLAGFFATFLGLLLFQIFFFELSTWLIVMCMTFMGLGMAFNYPIVMIITQYDVPKTQIGFATSAVFWIRNLGSTIGTGIMGLVMIMTFRSNVEKLSADENFKPFVTQIIENPDELLNPLVLQKLKSIPATHEAFFTALFWAFAGLLVMGFVSLVAAFWFPAKELKEN